jgi:hypothetical protein
VQEKVEGTSVGCAAGQTLGSPRRPLMALADSTVSGRGGGARDHAWSPFYTRALASFAVKGGETHRGTAHKGEERGWAGGPSRRSPWPVRRGARPGAWRGVKLQGASGAGLPGEVERLGKARVRPRS